MTRNTESHPIRPDATRTLSASASGPGAAARRTPAAARALIAASLVCGACQSTSETAPDLGSGPADSAAPTTDLSGLDGGSSSEVDAFSPRDAATRRDAAGGGDAFAGSDAGSDPSYPERSGRELIFFDDFESGDRSHSENGVAWTSTNTGGPDEVSVTDARAASGSHSLRFHFGGDSSLSDDAFAEQRFTLGELRADLWVGFRIYLPDGSEPGENRYVHRDAAGSDNNKLLRLWAPTYDGFKWGASFWPSADGLSTLVGDRSASCGAGIGPFGGSEWTLTDADLGRWMLWEIHIHGDDGSGNATYELWVDGVLVAADTSAIGGAPCAPNAFIDGYLMGWSNSGFDRDTRVYIDDVAFWEVR